VAASWKLFQTLFPPEAQAAIRRARQLLISPDGPLWTAPFAALVTTTTGDPRYLGLEKRITYTQSLTIFARSRTAPPARARGGRPRAVVVGNPIFDPASLSARRAANRQRKPADAPDRVATSDPPRGERYYLFRLFGDGKPPRQLDGSEAEATAIARLYETRPLLQERATEAALRPLLGSADVIHLASHGYLHPFRPMSSGVLLTVPGREPRIGETANDGALQAWEIYSQLRLRANLVVLSACETGLGQFVAGEGIVGLTRALQIAGARSVVASHWQVADRGTTTLMVAFHENLRRGLAKDEALRQAMATVRKNGRTAPPYYWAPFFLMGEPDNPNLGASRRRAGR
jgi:CHAT domain-containing protein